VVAEVSTEEVEVVLTEVEEVAEEVEVAEEDLIGDEEGVEVLIEEEEDEGEVGEAEAGVVLEEATLVRTGPAHWGTIVVVNLAQGTQSNPR